MSDTTSTVGECCSDDEIEALSLDSKTLALHLAVKNEDVIALQRIIASGDNINALNERGYTVLRVSASKGHVNITKVR